MIEDAGDLSKFNVNEVLDQVVVYNGMADLKPFVWRENGKITFVATKEFLAESEKATQLLIGLHETKHLSDISTLGFETYVDISKKTLPSGRPAKSAIERFVEIRAFRDLDNYFEGIGQKVPETTRAVHETFLKAHTR